MILNEHPIWPHLARYVDKLEGELVFLRVPEQLRALALNVVVNCDRCGAVISPLCERWGQLIYVACCTDCSQTPLEVVLSEQAADAAIERVGSGVDDTWLRQARAVVLDVAATLDTFSTDDVWRAGLPKPREPRALGYVMRQLAKAGHIEPTGDFHRTAQVLRHHAPVMMWRHHNSTIDAAEVGTCDALCLKEPWLELILLGIKTLETRTKCMRKRSGDVVLTSSTIDEENWNNPAVGGLLDAAARQRAQEGLGKMRGLVMMDPFVPGVPGVDDAAACIGILLPDGKCRFVSRLSNVRRLIEVQTMRISSYKTLVSGASQGFFRVPQRMVEMRA